MTAQYILIIAGNIVNAIETADIEAYKAANFAMPQLVIAVKHEVGMKTREAIAESIKAAKEAGIM